MNLYETALISNGSKKFLRNIFNNPTYNATILQNRLNSLCWIKENLKDYQGLKKIFRGVHSIDSILGKFHRTKV